MQQESIPVGCVPPARQLYVLQKPKSGIDPGGGTVLGVWP